MGFANVRAGTVLQGAGLEEEIDSLRAEVERTLAEVRAVHEQNQVSHQTHKTISDAGGRYGMAQWAPHAYPRS